MICLIRLIGSREVELNTLHFLYSAIFYIRHWANGGMGVLKSSSNKQI